MRQMMRANFGQDQKTIPYYRDLKLSRLLLAENMSIDRLFKLKCGIYFTKYLSIMTNILWIIIYES